MTRFDAGGPSAISFSRRRFISAGAGLGAAAACVPLASLLAPRQALAQSHEHAAQHGQAVDRSADSARWALPQRRQVTLATNANAICIAPVTIAQEKGFFDRYNLDVEYVNFGNSTDVLLEAIASGKADAGVGMALRWLKALEQGFDVKLTAGTHGGCLRLLAAADSEVRTLEDLRGRSVAVTDMADPGKNFFSIMLNRHGVDPNREIDWRVYPADLLGLAARKGEVQAVVGSDPWAYRLLDSGDFVEISNNLVEDYANLSCCVLGMTGTLVRNDTPTAAALTQAILDAHAWAAEHRQEVGELFIKHAVNVTAEETAAILGDHTHAHSATGPALADEIVHYADDLKKIDVLRPSTDSRRFADGITFDVFA
ncbi:ABC transporter substrate-binding protein [Halotalea alkalilenta]|uniref:ABC transporter substrate-binding protein n=1 Tax=Halotalea alkalilenta TaxID=376489 RepID=UPI0005BB9843|nr:ABC transporter substrate-binding protein [Halotalea alkalilenta]